MATVPQRRSRRYSSYQPQREVIYRTQRKGKWLKRLVIGTTLLVIVVLVAPMIIANTPLRNAPLRLAMQSLHGTVHAGGASLSWFGPISYSDIEIRAANGELLLAVPKISSERSLFDIVTHLNDLGTFPHRAPAGVVGAAARRQQLGRCSQLGASANAAGCSSGACQ